MNNITNDQCELVELLPRYVCSTLSEGEAEKVQVHLITCTVCQAEMKAPKPFAAALRMATDALPGPPSDLVARAMERIAAANLEAEAIVSQAEAEPPVITSRGKPLVQHGVSDKVVTVGKPSWREKAQDSAVSTVHRVFASVGTLAVVSACLIFMLGTTYATSYFWGEAKGRNQAKEATKVTINAQKAIIDEQRNAIAKLTSENKRLNERLFSIQDANILADYPVPALPHKPATSVKPRSATPKSLSQPARAIPITRAFEKEISTKRPIAYTTGFSLPENVTTAIIKLLLADNDSLAENGQITLTSRDGREIPIESLQDQGRILLLRVYAENLTPGWYRLTVDLNTRGILGGVKSKPFFSNFLVSRSN